MHVDYHHILTSGILACGRGEGPSVSFDKCFPAGSFLWQGSNAARQRVKEKGECRMVGARLNLKMELL